MYTTSGACKLKFEVVWKYNGEILAAIAMVQTEFMQFPSEVDAMSDKIIIIIAQQAVPFQLAAFFVNTRCFRLLNMECNEMQVQWLANFHLNG